jgi:curved DNA-binding protein CbpA
MTDLFALLGEPRRPWLDPESLKEKYHQLTAEHHPDVAGATADFAEINRAYQLLSDPHTRLRHLLDLESPTPPDRSQPVPPDIAAFFPLVAETRQAVDAFLKKNAAATSPITKALLAPVQYTVQERLEQTIATLSAAQETLLTQLREADAQWQTDHPTALAQLPALWQSLGYLAKWLTTLRESLYRLAAL